MKGEQMKKKVLKTIGFCLLGIVAVYVFFALCPRKDNYDGKNPMRKDGTLPLLIAHGGGNGEFPDNTLEAFYNAYSVDPNVMLETDVSITKDGVLIMSHDTTLDRKTNVTGSIIDWNYTDLLEKKVDFGYVNPTVDEKLNGERERFKDENGKEVSPVDVKYPEGITARDEKIFLVTRLEDLLIAFPNSRINVEIKQSGETGMKALKEALRLLEQYNAYDRVVLASFHREIYEEFQRLQKASEVPAAFMCSPENDGVTEFMAMHYLKLDWFFREQMAVFQIPTSEKGLDLATKALVRTAHKHNLAVHYWTINDVEEMKHLIEIGADGIMTDYPHRLQEVYQSYSAS